MIDPKYADLPGIAYDQPDIYETEDVPESENIQDYAQEDSDAIEKLSVNPTDVYNKFKDKRVNAKDVDFSDTISAKTKIGYTLCNEWRAEDESPLQKFERLKREVAELSDQFKTIKENSKKDEESKSLNDIIYQIENTGKELATLNIDKLMCKDAIIPSSNYQEVRFKELMSQIEIFKQKNIINESNESKKQASLPVQDKTGTLKYQMVYFPDKAKVQDVARIHSLEKRLGNLESLIGVTKNDPNKCSQILRTDGITKTVEKLMANARLLNSDQLDILENKVTSLMLKMDNVIQKKALMVQETKHEKLISELYDLVKQSENYSQILPQVVDRMISLSGLHGKAAEFASQLKELEDLQQNIGSSLTNNKTLLDEMQKNFSNNLDVISKDIASLNERVNKIKK